MISFELRDIPADATVWFKHWQSVADAIRSNAGAKAVFVPANGKDVRKLRENAVSSVRRYVNRDQLRTAIAKDESGIYLWLEEVA